ncbi:carbohydrate kinase family protein [Paenibacillus sp. LHD-38]|uniref:carbohydrate kinase family protein n=1 Tax=Paenibacillus sp. LHD-38 TaxID=3072143 RepID=UPI00280CE61D|nr:carbohydrate kinase family protein [Paenibacillus sp. LHD-38]MDQ8734717.1 carbohydrate kinase family protein [Paenibacillus sp. LHD-38]
MKTYDAVVIGDANVDLVITGCNELPLPGQEVFVRDMTIHVGGGAALFSITLAKLGKKLAFKGILGKDYYGQYILNQFHRYGIDTSYVKKSDLNQTGISIAINPERDRSFISYAGTNSELQLGQVAIEDLVLSKHVHITGYKGSVNHKEFMAIARELNRSGITVSLDVGWDDTGEWYQGIFELMAWIDVLFMNETEAVHYTGCETIGESIPYLTDKNKNVVVKLGSKGAVSIMNGTATYCSGYNVEVVDTTGAGDSFNAGYIYGFLSGMPVKDCLVYGNACGALSVGAYGGSTGTVDLPTLEQFIEARQSEISL